MSPECVVVEPESGLYQRMIFSGEFRKVLAVWDAYCSREITRKTIAELTHHSTYLLPIIHWLEEKGRRETIRK